MTVWVPFRASADLPRAAAAVREVMGAHGVCAFPTETFYGLGCDPHDAQAVSRVFALKGRPGEKALPLVAATMDQVNTLAVIAEEWQQRLTRVWPAPLTVIVPVRTPLAAAGGTVAVRIPAHPLLRALLARVGPLTATSANRAGAQPAATPAALAADLCPEVDLVLDGADTAGGLATTLLDLTAVPPAVLRKGAWAPPREWGVKTA